MFTACKKSDDSKIAIEKLKDSPFYSMVLNNEVLEDDSDYELNARIKGYTVLQYLVWNQFSTKKDSEERNVEVFKSFIDKGADIVPYIKDINGTNSKNQTVLHYAAAACIDYEIVEFLIKNGADKTKKDINGKTACDIYVDYYSLYDENYRLLKI